MRTGCVYSVSVTGTNLVYIGSTLRGLRQRRLEHLHYLRHGTHFSTKFQKAFDEHGESSLVFTMIADGVEEDKLIDFEQIEILRIPKEFLLNSTNIAEPIYSAREIMLKTGAHQSEEVKAKRVASRRKSLEEGKWHPRVWSDEDREKHSNRLKGRSMPPVSESTKMKISIANKGKKCPELAIKNSVEARTGFIEKEVSFWVELRLQGKSFREIERITGRTRRVISREVGRVLNA